MVKKGTLMSGCRRGKGGWWGLGLSHRYGPLGGLGLGGAAEVQVDQALRPRVRRRGGRGLGGGG